MLLSTCPNCGAQFKVAPEQLNVRQGRVMCGRCRNVFNAFESLKRIGDSDAGETVDYSIVDARHNDPVASAGGADLRDNGNPPLIHASDDPAGSHDTSPGREARIDTTPGDAAPAGHVDPLHDFAEASGDREGNPAIDKPVDAPESNNPLIVGPMPTGERAHGAGGWRWLGGLAGVLLVLQTLYFFRSEIVRQYPPLRPSLVSACEIAGCTVAFGRDANAIKIESSDLIEPPGKPGRILLTAIIANRANAPQDFPFLEVKLMDANNAVLSSRVLSPGEYLGRLPSRDDNIAANAELYVNLNLELAGKAPASGYGLRAFYP